MYAIIDLETTGSIHYTDRITEIAIFLHDGKRVVEEFSTLVNPERPIPFFVSRLTGISNKMVADAPKFAEVAPKILELTKDAVFIAHNSSFDYNFLKSEFKTCGYTFRRNSLCTVQLSRKFLPGMASYSLGKLCKLLEIPLEGRHRAGGDALATVKLFERILECTPEPEILGHLALDTWCKKYHGKVAKHVLDNLQEKPGVYYLFDKLGEMLFIGKGNNIRNKVMAHFCPSDSQKAQELKELIADVQVEYTGSELLANLLEISEIKKHQPQFNLQRQRKTQSKFGIYQFTDKQGFLNFYISKIVEETAEPVTRVFTYRHAHSLLEQVVEKYNICPKRCGLQQLKEHCTNSYQKRCNGICQFHDEIKGYNQRAERAIRFMHYEHENFFLIDKGRDEHEKSVVQIEQGAFKGFGYVDITEGVRNPEVLQMAIKPFPEDTEVTSIISQYIRKRKMEKLLKYEPTLP